MLTVRELFLKALSMKLSGAAWPRIQDTLISAGHDIGIRKIGSDFVEFRSGQRIWFDGKCHLTTLWQGWSSMRPLAPAETSTRMRPVRLTVSSKWPAKKCAAAKPSIGK